MKLKLLLGLISILQYSSAQQSVCVYGRIIHPKDNKVYIKYYSDYLSYQEVAVDSAHLDKQGHFKMTFSWKNAYPAIFYYGDEIMEMFLTPGDSLNLQLDAKHFDSSLSYTGKGSLANNHILKEFLFDNYPTGETYLLPEEEYISWVDSVSEQAKQRLAEDLKTGMSSDPNVIPYLNFAKNEIIYNQANLKLDYPALNAYVQKLKGYTPVSTGYYDFLNELT